MCMFYGFLKFDSLPQIGFAHHFYMEKYSYTYGNSFNRSFEIVYISSGDIRAELYGETFLVKEGSIFVLFRDLPIKLTSVDGKPQAHCTVQAEFDYDFTLLKEPDAQSGGILLPFVTAPCSETERVKAELFSITSDVGVSREENSFSASLRFLGIMQKLDRIARRQARSNVSSSSLISYRVKNFIAKNIQHPITLATLSDELRKSPNYINSAFKTANGITVNQYIANVRVNRIAELMQVHGLSFKAACENTAINDLSYGYRLFKKHTGITPGEFLGGMQIKK